VLYKIYVSVKGIEDIFIHTTKNELDAAELARRLLILNEVSEVRIEKEEVE